MSIGSVGGRDDNNVSNILITNSQVVNSANGVRIKTVSGATGSVDGITYSNISLSGITSCGIVVSPCHKHVGLLDLPNIGSSGLMPTPSPASVALLTRPQIEQDYENGSPTGTPTSGVPITDLTVSGVTGTVASGAQDVYILCASCSAWTWTGVSITGGSAKKTCEGIPSGASC